jgi:hypothetical protein
LSLIQGALVVEVIAPLAKRKRATADGQGSSAAADLPRSVWVGRFVMKLSDLGVRAEPEMIVAMAEEL